MKAVTDALEQVHAPFGCVLFELSVVCAQADDAPSSVMFWRYSVSGSCQGKACQNIPFPRIMLRERSRDNRPCCPKRFNSSEFKFWNSYEQPPEIVTRQSPAATGKEKPPNKCHLLSRSDRGRPRSYPSGQGWHARAANLRCRMSRIVLWTAMYHNFPT